MGEGKNREVTYVSRPHLEDADGVPTFKMPNTKAGQWYRSRDPKLPPVPLSKNQTRRAQRQYATTYNTELEWANKRGEPHMKESGLKAEEDQVMIEAEANGIHQEIEQMAEGLMAEDEEYGDEE
ncbi:hypothetical protein L3X38_042381 [Prunus dulcis]|uniref:Uncharacterized protein n=1 Tax=Prunus dulcis TaxID=3755 RepID=A0AAD4YK97_PRUDU|nr:hypothetical protein L3X38_042381 [Prunus dulcis]